MSRTSLAHAIPPDKLILLDTAALISHFKGTEPVSPLATHVIERFVETGRNRAIVSAVTATELLHDPLKTGNNSLYHQVVFFLMQTSHLGIAEVDFRVAHRAAYLRAIYGFKTPDALILGTGLVASAEVLVTNDAMWKRITDTGESPALCYLEDHL